ncbi:MAG: transcriptional regulator [Polyangiaceae bacterium]|nr:transcriptional regulator [Polyangiaceae bacterium]
MLRLVEPPKEGQEKRARRRKNPRLSLTSAERTRLRAAVRNLARAFGSYECLAVVVGVPKHSLHHVGSTSKVSYAFAVAIARAVGMTVDQLIGPLASVDVCPTCGARKGAR